MSQEIILLTSETILWEFRNAKDIPESELEVQRPRILSSGADKHISKTLFAHSKGSIPTLMHFRHMHMSICPYVPRYICHSHIYTYTYTSPGTQVYNITIYTYVQIYRYTDIHIYIYLYTGIQVHNITRHIHIHMFCYMTICP